MPARVVLYTQPTCAPCDQVKEFLTRNGVEFETRDVSLDPEALDELTEMGYLATPVTLIGSEAVVGFDQKRLERLLDSMEQS